MNVKIRLSDVQVDDIVASLETKKANQATESVYNHLIKKLRLQLSGVELYPEMFEEFKKNIIRQFFTSKVSAGENVGILIAQSIGEKQTQMSIAYDECVYIKNGNTLENVKMGEYIDNYILYNKESVVELDHGSCIISTEDKNLFVPSVSKHGHISFKKLTMLSRHKPNGSMFKIKTDSGHTVLCTGSHSLLTKDKLNNVVPIKACNVTVGTKMPILDAWQDVFINTSSSSLSEPMAKILGIFLRCGAIKKDVVQFTVTSENDRRDILKYVQSNTSVLHVDKSPTEMYVMDKYLLLFIKSCKSIPLFMISNYNKDTVYNFLTGVLPVEYAESKKNFVSVSISDAQFVNDLGLVLKVGLPSLNFKISSKKLSFKVDDFKSALKKSQKGGGWGCFSFNCSRSNKIRWVDICEMNEVEEKDYAFDYVYDFSVHGNETFMLSNGLFVHNTLNTFHTTGLTVNTVVTGVPRLLELMNTTKEPKLSSCTINFKYSDTIRNIIDIRNYIGNALKCTTVNSLIDEYHVVDLKDIRGNWWLRDLQQGNIADKVLRIQMSHKKMYEGRICLSSMVEKINSTFEDIFVISSSINECILDIFILDKDSITLPQKQISYINDDNKYDVFLEEIVLKKFEKFAISGIPKINDFMIYTVTPGKEWGVSTEGSNLKGIMECDLFDPNTIVSNNMWEIYHTLGIEAAREFLINEFINVISSDGTFINKCHVYLLVDFMTFKGDISSISRYSLRNKTSPLARSSFEESIENFLKSGIFTEVDNMKSISSNIMTGKLSHTGTGICDLLVDNTVYFKEDCSKKKIDSVYKIVNDWLVDDTSDDVNNTLVMLPTIFERDDEFAR